MDRQDPNVAVTGAASSHMVDVPGFTVQGKLGGGGMGVVSLAYQESLDRQVALKRVALDVSAPVSNLRALLEVEARLVAQLDHPTIVHVHDLLEADGDVVVVMEYVRGASLPAVQAAGEVTRGQLLAVVRAVADALDHAHGRDVVHLDVKPENVLVGPKCVCKLSDFGIARLVGQGGRMPPAARRWTSFYAAPELSAGRGRIDHRADVYSLGVMARELLLRPSASAAVTGDAPFEVEQAINSATQTDRRLRPDTAGQLWRMLEAAADRAWPGWRAEADVPLTPPTFEDGAAEPAPPEASTVVASAASRAEVPSTREPSAAARTGRTRRRIGAAPTVLASGGLVAIGLTSFLLGVSAAGAARVEPVAVTGLSLAVSSAAVGQCPTATFRFDGRVATNGGGGPIVYEWLRPDGGRTGRMIARMRAHADAVALFLDFTYQGRPARPVVGTAALHVVSPADVYSPPVTVTFQCGSSAS